MASRHTEHRLATARAMGIAFVAIPLLSPLLPQGGLVPLGIAAAAALLVGAPAAVAEWRQQADLGDPVQRTALASTAELIGLLLVSNALATIAHGDTAGLLLALGAQLAGALLATRPAWGAALALLGTAGIAAATAADLSAAPPWTLLEPRWETWPETVGPAVAVGVLLGGAGTGQWTFGGLRPPGDRFAPWAAVGLGLGAATLLAVDEAARYEAGLGQPTPSLAVTAAFALAAASAAGAVSGRSGGRAWVRAAGGLALTLLLAGPAWEIRTWLVGALVPLAAAIGLGAVAVRAAGSDRLAMGAAGALLAGSVALSWPGLPGRTLDAIAVGAVLVAAFWFVATRSLLARRVA